MIQVVNRDLSVTILSHFAHMRLLEHDLRIKRIGARRGTDGRVDQGDEEEDIENTDAQKEEEEKKEGQVETEKKVQFPGLYICEALAASGLRSIRYALEVPLVRSILANDRDAAAVADIKRHLEANAVSNGLVVVNQADAVQLLASNRYTFDVVDLDPYGSASVFLDAAVQSVKEGGLLAVTCTDMAVLCGANGEACFAKYGAYPIKAEYCHEQALRILLGTINVHAARYKRYLVPVASFSIDFYVRVFVRVFTSASKTKEAGSKMGYLFQCSHCDYFATQKMAKIQLKGNSKKYQPASLSLESHICPHCEGKLQMAGPMWMESLHDRVFVEKVIQSLSQSAEVKVECGDKESNQVASAIIADQALASVSSECTLSCPIVSPAHPFSALKRILALLSLAFEELPDCPFYYSLSSIASTLHSTTIKSAVVRSALHQAGYRVSLTHALPNAIKTNAPVSVLYDVYKVYLAKNPHKVPPGPTTPAFKIMKIPPVVQYTWNESFNLQASNYSQFIKFLQNPTAEWGPKSRASGKNLQVAVSLKRKSGAATLSLEVEKSLQNQGKKQKIAHRIPYSCKNFKPEQPDSCQYGDSCKYLHTKV